MSNAKQALWLTLRKVSEKQPKALLPTMEFHIGEAARKQYNFDKDLFSSTGNVIFANFHSARLFAKKMNEKKDLLHNPEETVKAGQVNAMGLIDEILHHVLALYKEENGTSLFDNLLSRLNKHIGDENVYAAMQSFCKDFPPKAVYNGDLSVNAYLKGKSQGVPHTSMILEELIMLYLSNKNPAFSPFKELFDDSQLKDNSVYHEILVEIHAFFQDQPLFGPEEQALMDMLKTPMMAAPYSLSGQLSYMREHWGLLLSKYLFRLLSSLDFIKEENRPFFGDAIGAVSPEVYTYTKADEEFERFSEDKEWMPKVVLLAKSTLVWLDQLSKEYERPIYRLDEVPDEELDRIASFGFNALWLIGLWNRSQASKRIKRSCGNPDAEASAYALDNYDIAWELGGWEALKNLRSRLWRRGIRLSSDMVPNHTGMDSEWVIQHPDWFIQKQQIPFPGYSYNSQNLSPVDGLGIYLEDHYYDKTDAAVAFKRVDFNTGDTRYIYHGNDGTHMPWNDTAQLNFLNAEAREAVIQTILHVARNFSVIRFDAAMVLAKRHIQRLWFPIPGQGGDIPSRAEDALSPEDFDKAIPLEFWREVVDRVAQEVPDTLLLAEAFWMMEGYFVRTLGMHRVYNSAFMHMLKDEENAKYRATIKNTQEFDPEILKRFVNFMNNPDEETAAQQFGKGDKYFGICTLMVTMPGLPMFGHGQIEGFHEKYGMEYRKAYWNEEVDADLRRRHRQEIVPLIQKRYLFAEVKNFFLYDFYCPEHHVNENVFAYSNSHGEEKALIFYNNAYEAAKGWIKSSSSFAVKQPDGSKQLQQRELGSVLGISGRNKHYCIYREQRSNLWYIEKSEDLVQHGFFVELDGYEYKVFLDFHEVDDSELEQYSLIYQYLHGQGTLNLDSALKEFYLKPVHEAFQHAFHRDKIIRLKEWMHGKEQKDSIFLTQFFDDYETFLESSRDFYEEDTKIEPIVMETKENFNKLYKLIRSVLENPSKKQTANYAYTEYNKHEEAFFVLIFYVFMKNIGLIVKGELPEQSRSLLDEWLLNDEIRKILHKVHVKPELVDQAVGSIELLIVLQNCFEETDHLAALYTILHNEEMQNYLQVNRYNNTLWYNKEAFETACFYLHAINLLEKGSSAKQPQEIASEWLAAAEKSQYKLEELVQYLEDQTQR